MAEEQSQQSSRSSQSSPHLSSSVAIVVAGALIAAAIYFGGGGSSTGSQPAAGGVAGNEGAALEPEAAAAVGDIRPVSDDDHIRGPATAKVTVIEYSDLECPFCKRFHPTMTQLREEFPDDVRWVYRHFPLEAIHPNARGAALATECAGEQGKFWELADYMFENTSSGADLADGKLPELAQLAGVPNSAQFATCLESEKFDDRIELDLADAQAAGGRGTPYSVIIGPDGEKEALSGALPYAAVKSAVEKYL